MDVKTPTLGLLALMIVVGETRSQDYGTPIDQGGALQIACEAAQGCGGLTYEDPVESIRFDQPYGIGNGTDSRGFWIDHGSIPSATPNDVRPEADWATFPVSIAVWK